MRSYKYSLLIFISLGLTLTGCSSVREESPTNQNNSVVGAKDGPELPKNDQTGVSGEDSKAITVYKSSTCGCCTAWESYLTKAGFHVTSVSTDEMTDIKEKYKVPEQMQSCHTAVIDGYVIEGHVPADDILKLLRTRPNIVGLAAPGMPQESPGMQPEGEKPANFDVFSFDEQAKTNVFSSY